MRFRSVGCNRGFGVLITGVRAIQILLLAAAAYLLWLGLSPLVGAQPVPEANVPDPRPAPDDRPGLAAYQVIAQRNLFKTRQSSASIEPVEEAFAESKLNLRLLGTLAAVPAKFSVATIEDVAKRETLALKTGDVVSGATVVRIEPRRVVIDNRGKLEQITLEEAKPASSRAVRPPRSRTRTPRRTPRREPAQTRQRPSPSAAAGARTSNALASIFSNLELEPGETVQSVNGIDFADQARLPDLIELVTEPGNGTVDVVIVDQEGVAREITLEMP